MQVALIRSMLDKQLPHLLEQQRRHQGAAEGPDSSVEAEAEAATEEGGGSGGAPAGQEGPASLQVATVDSFQVGGPATLTADAHAVARCSAPHAAHAACELPERSC